MSTVQEIEQAILALTPEQYVQLRDWFSEVEANRWDAQIERDVMSGKLDKLAEEALADLDAGRCREL